MRLSDSLKAYGFRTIRSEVARRFRRAGRNAMAAYVDPRNPSCGFFERIGGRWLIEPDGRTNFSWSVWHNLTALDTLSEQPG